MGRPPIVGDRPLTGSERVKRYRERRRKGERSERQLSDAEKAAQARREVRSLSRLLREAGERAATSARHAYYEHKRLEAEIERLRQLLAEHGAPLPPRDQTGQSVPEHVTTSASALRRHCICALLSSPRFRRAAHRPVER
jgi:predicted ArsR family transcriptional regulator